MSSKNYKYIFFDLDHTLWDYETNSFDTLRELFDSYELMSCGIHDCTSFQHQFRKVNLELWDLYDRGLITNDVIRSQRFKRILEHFNVHDENLCADLTVDYLDNCPRKDVLIPHAFETLQYLSQHYKLTVITNGFEEIQNMKLAAAKLGSFFDHVVTSQKAGARKPAKEIFHYALDASNISAHEAIMIGDNLNTDIAGAKNASIDAIFFNPDGIVHSVEIAHEISNLRELQNIL